MLYIPYLLYFSIIAQDEKVLFPDMHISTWSLKRTPKLIYWSYIIYEHLMSATSHKALWWYSFHGRFVLEHCKKIQHKESFGSSLLKYYNTSFSKIKYSSVVQITNVNVMSPVLESDEDSNTGSATVRNLRFSRKMLSFTMSSLIKWEEMYQHQNSVNGNYFYPVPSSNPDTQ